ncbi:MAG: sigma factor [Blastocatellia bacterium]
MTTIDSLFEEFLARLEPEIPSTVGQYHRLRIKLIKFFEWRYCRDREGLTDETISRLLKHIREGEQIGKPWGYLYAIATNVYREYMRKAARLVEIKDDLELPMLDSDGFVECAKLCFGKLSDDKRLLLAQYYSEDVSREELARQAGASLAGMRTKIHRLKAELKKCYQECIQDQVVVKRN